VIALEVAEAVEVRRARRVLSDRSIEDDKVRTLLRAANLSASCFNNQPWRLVFCTSQESLGAVKAALAKGNAWATRAPLIVAVAAKELGLIAHPIAGYDPAKVRAALGIPEEYIVIALVICAYPGTDDSLLSDKQKEAERQRPERKPQGENMFVGRWGSPLV
jgi:nitroreductase